MFNSLQLLLVNIQIWFSSYSKYMLHVSRESIFFFSISSPLCRIRKCGVIYSQIYMELIAFQISVTLYYFFQISVSCITFFFLDICDLVQDRPQLRKVIIQRVHECQVWVHRAAELWVQYFIQCHFRSSATEKYTNGQ